MQPRNPCARRLRRVGVHAAVALAFLTGACGQMATSGRSTPMPAAPGAVVATVPVGRGPILLALSPDGRRLYAASKGKVSAIDLTTNQVTGSVEVNPYAAGLAVSPDGGKAYLSTLLSTRLQVIDTASLSGSGYEKLFAERILGGYGRFAISPDGGRAYVTNIPNALLTIVELGGGSAHDVLLDIRPQDVVLNADGTRAYLCGCDATCSRGQLEVLDLKTERILMPVSVGPNPYRVVLSPDGKRAYTSNLTDGTVSVVEIGSDSALTNVSVGPEPTGLAIAPDGGTVYATSVPGGVLAAIDTKSNTVRATMRVGAVPREVVISRDSSRAYVSAGDSVVVVDTRALR